jgi:hypothetical protein
MASVCMYSQHIVSPLKLRCFFLSGPQFRNIGGDVNGPIWDLI